MSVYLKSLAVLVALLGTLAGVGFAMRVLSDAEFAQASLMRERNAGNLLFESEYRIAQAAHVFLIYSTLGSLLIAVVGGSLLWGVGSLHEKLDRR
jgi:hypothetical protein